MGEYVGGGGGDFNGGFTPDDMVRMMCNFFQSNGNHGGQYTSHQHSYANPGYQSHYGNPSSHGNTAVAAQDYGSNRQERFQKRKRSRSRSMSKSRSQSPVRQDIAQGGPGGHGSYRGRQEHHGNYDRQQKFIESAKHRNSLAWKACFRTLTDVKVLTKELDDAIYACFNGDGGGNSSGSESESEEGEERDRSSPRKRQVSTKDKSFRKKLINIHKKLSDLNKCSISNRDLELGENFVWVGQECGHICHVQSGEEHSFNSTCKKCGVTFRAPPRKVSSRYKIH